MQNYKSMHAAVMICATAVDYPTCTADYHSSGWVWRVCTSMYGWHWI